MNFPNALIKITGKYVYPECLRNVEDVPRIYLDLPFPRMRTCFKVTAQHTTRPRACSFFLFYYFLLLKSTRNSSVLLCFIYIIMHKFCPPTDTSPATLECRERVRGSHQGSQRTEHAAAPQRDCLRPETCERIIKQRSKRGHSQMN